MKLILIPKIEVENRHPKGMHSATDMEYARIATEIATAMSKLKIVDISAEGLKLLGLNVAMYFEDVVADAGIWRGFTNLVKEQKGKFLPFFDLDENNYYQDEPNIEDVKFLVWYTMLEVHHGRVANPESPIIMQLAEAAFAVLEKNFETVSVNEELKTFFANAQFADNFFEQRDVLKWLCFGCYLTYIPHLTERLLAQAQEMARRMQGNLDLAFYLSESLLPYDNKIGPLGLLPQNWVASILRANGNTEVADAMGNQQFKEYRGYKILSGDEGKNMTFEDINGDTFTVSAENLAFPTEECYKQKMIIASFVKYKDTWYLNAPCAWSDDLQPYEALRDEYTGKENMKEAYDKLKKDTSLYYFADQKAMEKFLLENLPFNDEVKKNFKLPESENVVLFIPKDFHEDFQILPDAALCIKDEHNPYYNSKMALNQALNLALSLREEVRDYIISHNLLPDATINSSLGLKRGNEIVQQNFDFLVKAVTSRL